MGVFIGANIRWHVVYAYYCLQAIMSHCYHPLAAGSGQSWVLLTRVVVNAVLTMLHCPNLSAAADMALRLQHVYTYIAV